MRGCNAVTIAERDAELAAARAAAAGKSRQRFAGTAALWCANTAAAADGTPEHASYKKALTKQRRRC